MNLKPTAATGDDTADPEATVRRGPGAAASPAPTPVGPDRPAAAAPPVRDPDPAAAPLPPGGIPSGTLLVNTYRVERLLGSGGMGDVYLTRHALLDTQHAVKVTRSSMAANPKVTDLFYREARVLRGVRHDAIVSYEGFVQDTAGRAYLVMEYVEGPSLAARLQQGALPLDEVLRLRDRLAAGLAEAHRRGAIHRDISPDNVILPDNQVAAAKLIDFGLSKLIDPDQESIVGSSFAGKCRFASPEQFGFFGREIDARSDIYSLGLVLAAAALGRPLDRGATFEAILGACQRAPDLGEIPAPLRPWLAAMLEPDPAHRPASLDEILARWPAPGRAGMAPGSAGVGAGTGRERGGRRSGRAWPLIGTALLVSAAAVAYALLRPPVPVVPTHPAVTADTRPAVTGQPRPSAPPAPPDPLIQTAPGDGQAGTPTGPIGQPVTAPPPAPVAPPAAPVAAVSPPASTTAPVATEPPPAPTPPPVTTEPAPPAAADAALARATEIRPDYVQRALQDLGHYRGKNDGDLGGASQKAIRAWQTARGLAQTGRLDQRQTVDLLVQAADSGHPQSQYTLGMMRASGIGLPKDADAARAWFEKSAAQGNAYAAYNLGVLYRDGLGVTASAVKARTWFEQARRGGHPDAAKALAQIR